MKAAGLVKRYGERTALRGVSFEASPGEIVAIIGPNGAGKTTLLRMLIGELPPDAGTVRHGANVQVAYYDQQREQLDPERTVVDTVGEGRDTVTVNGVASTLLQTHFHAPSEHTIEGVQYAAEMHFVPKAADGALTVVGVMIAEEIGRAHV